MTLRYTIGPSDYKRAMWLHMRPRRFLAVMGAFLLILMVAILSIASYRFFTIGRDLHTVLGLGGGLGFICLWFFFYMPYRLRGIYLQQKLLHEELIVEISEAQLITKSLHGQGTMPWEIFHKWKANKQLVLVYQSDAAFHIFPKQAFPLQEEFKTFQSILRSKLGPQKA
jgi:hypothetical protein